MTNSLCDFFTLSETKIDGPCHSAEFSVEKYDPNAHVWCVITYIKSDLPHTGNSDIDSTRNDIENIAFEIRLPAKEKYFSVHAINQLIWK